MTVLEREKQGIFAIGMNNKIEVIHDKNVFPNSLGLIYAALTSYLGWKYALTGNNNGISVL